MYTAAPVDISAPVLIDQSPSLVPGKMGLHCAVMVPCRSCIGEGHASDKPESWPISSRKLSFRAGVWLAFSLTQP